MAALGIEESLLARKTITTSGVQTILGVDLPYTYKIIREIVVCNYETTDAVFDLYLRLTSGPIGPIDLLINKYLVPAGESRKLSDVIGDYTLLTFVDYAITAEMTQGAGLTFHVYGSYLKTGAAVAKIEEQLLASSVNTAPGYDVILPVGVPAQKKLVKDIIICNYGTVDCIFDLYHIPNLTSIDPAYLLLKEYTVPVEETRKLSDVVGKFLIMETDFVSAGEELALDVIQGDGISIHIFGAYLVII